MSVHPVDDAAFLRPKGDVGPGASPEPRYATLVSLHVLLPVLGLLMVVIMGGWVVTWLALTFEASYDGTADLCLDTLMAAFDTTEDTLTGLTSSLIATMSKTFTEKTSESLASVEYLPDYLAKLFDEDPDLRYERKDDFAFLMRVRTAIYASLMSNLHTGTFGVFVTIAGKASLSYRYEGGGVSTMSLTRDPSNNTAVYTVNDDLTPGDLLQVWGAFVNDSWSMLIHEDKLPRGAAFWAKSPTFRGATGIRFLQRYDDPVSGSSIMLRLSVDAGAYQQALLDVFGTISGDASYSMRAYAVVASAALAERFADDPAEAADWNATGTLTLASHGDLWKEVAGGQKAYRMDIDSSDSIIAGLSRAIRSLPGGYERASANARRV
ncbi:hypothetical protein DIPPA_30643 [Diplonema papillatum]|nr:hypothetical protein DIPPA_30643 [Diplonema papillatum]